LVIVIVTATLTSRPCSDVTNVTATINHQLIVTFHNLGCRASLELANLFISCCIFMNDANRRMFYGFILSSYFLVFVFVKWLVCIRILHTYIQLTLTSPHIPKEGAEVSQIFLREAQVLPKLCSYEEYCRRDKW
jgi:hypothetical protein